jgi:CBS domain-containing protein
MTEKLITVDVQTTANDAIKLMVEKDIGSVVVTEKGKPVGIVTERDILKKCCLNAACQRVKVGEIMSKPLITVDANTPIGAAVELMVEKNIRRLLVTEDGEVKGIVTQKDLMRGTLDAFHTIASLPT